MFRFSIWNIWVSGYSYFIVKGENKNYLWVEQFRCGSVAPQYQLRVFSDQTFFRNIAISLEWLSQPAGATEGNLSVEIFCKNLQSHIFIEWFYYYVFALSLEKVNVFYWTCKWQILGQGSLKIFTWIFILVIKK